MVERAVKIQKAASDGKYYHDIYEISATSRSRHSRGTTSDNRRDI